MNPKILLDLVKNASENSTQSPDNTTEILEYRGLYDRILDGINRTGRPLLLVSAIAFFAWGIVDPKYFVIVMKAFAETPEFIATAILLVISIFGGGRIIGDFKKRAVVKQTISTTVEKEVNDETADAMLASGRFANLDDNNIDVIGAGEEIVSMEPENSAIDAWKKKKK